ncbi:MAG: Cna B-type domain-containing protein [Mogibacterium sp.]|nr:Cna B-type domain-containing protein [Mogibacterium sp.]
MMRQTANLSTVGIMNVSPAKRDKTLLSGPLKASSDGTAALQSYFDSLKNKDEVTCAGEEGAARTYKEVVDTYTITAGNGWDLDITDLPKYNEYGRRYKYYLVETPVTGYDTTYTGQESGLQDDNTDLEIINIPKTTELTVTKEWAFGNPSSVVKVEGKEWPQGVTVHVVVYSRTGENDPAPTAYTVDLTAARPTYTFEGLPEYSGNDKIEYSVVEAGVTGLDSEHFDTVIEGNAESGYTIKNTEKEAGLTIIKAFEGSELTEAQKNAITFTVTGAGLKDRNTGSSVESLTKTYAAFTEGRWVLNQSDGIVNGRTYTVTETNANYEHYSRVTTVKVNDGEASSFPQSGEETNPSGSVTMSNYQGTVTVTNIYTKLVDLKIIKVDANGMETPLVGALFELRKVDPESTAVHYLDDAATLPTTTGADHKTGSNGEAVFTDLAPGYYEVKEAEMPAGYVRTGDGVYYIKVENSIVSHVERTITEDDLGGRHVTWTPGTDDAKFVFTASSGENPATAKVGNEPGASLPNTGGPGTRSYMLLGSILILGSGVLLWRRRRLI